MTGAAAAPSLPRRACIFGTYYRSHTATDLLRAALQHAGCTVSECHVSLWEDTRDKMATYFRLPSLARLLLTYLRGSFHLASALRRQGVSDLYVAGFNGQLDVVLLRLLRRAPILFAPLVTITETLVDDRGVYRPGGAMARMVGLLDRLSLRFADRVVIDTEAHRRYLIDELGIAPGKVSTWHLGADSDLFSPRPPRRRSGPLRVLFYGQFLPLHGLPTIAGAVARLAQAREFEFTVIGTGPEREGALAALPVTAGDCVRRIEWVPYEQLPSYIADADVCLGSFGTSSKAQMVIPNKVYQAATVGRAVVTADSAAIREVFTPATDIVVCPPGDPQALADALLSVRDDGERTRIAVAAQRLMAERFNRQAQADRLRAILLSVPCP